MGFLEEMVRERRRSLSDPSYGREISGVRKARPPSLRTAVERDRERGALLVEYKRASPGRPDPQLPPRSVTEFLNATEPASPTAYSCLATEPRFEGSPADVAELARKTPRPVLYKDFVIDRRQVEIAVRTGASAILLIARLDRAGWLSEPLATLAEVARHSGLEVLLEFHSRTELSRGADVAADMYGVNTRDLDSLTIDVGAAEATLAEARAQGLRPLLGLSGVETTADAERFWRGGADGILVGTAVARSSEPARFLSTLLRPESGVP